MPRFSLITVTYNNLDGLKKTVASLDAQLCQDFEWLVVDGASTDGTLDYLKGTNADWTSEPDESLYDAMNKGIDRAQGEYLLFLNAGDELANNTTLETIKQALAPTERGLGEGEKFPALIYGDALEEVPGKAPAYKTANPHTKADRGLFTHHQAMLYRREVIGTLRYDLRYKIAADYDFTLRFLQQNNDNTLYIPAPLCLFEAGGVSQRRTALGRAEQFHIRKEVLRQSLLDNYMTVARQISAQYLKDTIPPLYWKLRR